MLRVASRQGRVTGALRRSRRRWLCRTVACRCYTWRQAWGRWARDRERLVHGRGLRIGRYPVMMQWGTRAGCRDQGVRWHVMCCEPLLAGGVGVCHRDCPPPEVLPRPRPLPQAGAVEWLLQHGCDACAPASERQLTPLHAAALSGDPDTIAVLLKNGGLVHGGAGHVCVWHWRTARSDSKVQIRGASRFVVNCQVGLLTKRRGEGAWKAGQ